MTNARQGSVAGEYQRYIRGHVGYLVKRDRLTDDLWAVEDRGHDTPCWIWNGVPRPNGYARTKFQGRVGLAHRLMYEQEIGAIPEGLTLDHLCRVRNCVNPDHLEPVTTAVNVQRGRTTRITPEIVQAVRLARGPNKAIAEAFGLGQSHVSMIRSRRIWKNI